MLALFQLLGQILEYGLEVVDEVYVMLRLYIALIIRVKTYEHVPVGLVEFLHLDDEFQSKIRVLFIIVLQDSHETTIIRISKHKRHMNEPT